MRASALERFAYGRPLSPPEDVITHVKPRNTTALIGRFLIAAIFIASGITKLANPDQPAHMLEAAGAGGAAYGLAVVAGLAELLGGLSILFGVLTRVGAIGLAIFMVPTTLLFHDFWNYNGVEHQMQMVNFMKNLGIVGGLLTLVAHGAGRLSVDGGLRWPKQS